MTDRPDPAVLAHLAALGHRLAEESARCSWNLLDDMHGARPRKDPSPVVVFRLELPDDDNPRFTHAEQVPTPAVGEAGPDVRDRWTPLLARFAPDAQQALLAALRASLASGGLVSLDLQGDAPGRWYTLQALPGPRSGGRRTWDGFLLDITDGKDAEQVLQLELERVRLALDGTRDGLWDWNLRTDEAFHSDRFATMLGYQPGELPDTSAAWSDLLHPDDREVATARVQAYLRGERPGYESIFRMRTRDGQYRWILGRGKASFDADGTPLRFVGLNADITERVEAERALAESEARFSALFSRSPLGIAYHRMVYDADGQPRDYFFIDANEHYLELTGVDPRGKLVTEAFPGIEDDPFDWIGTFGHTARTGEAVRFQQHLSHNDRWYDVVTFQSSPDHFVVSFLEITEQRRLEEQLRQAQKMEAVGQLAGGVAHDFNNLLQAIRGYTELTLGEVPEGSPARANLAMVMQASDRASALVGQLLAFSRQQVLEMKAVDLNEVVHDMLRMLSRVIGEQIELTFLPGRDLSVVRADPGQLGQILANLCVNARDAMVGGGKIAIETENVLIDESFCRHHNWARPGRYVLLSVTDDGCGIPPESLERVFEPFYTTKSAGKGTGLGLATVYGLVQQHDGMVHVYSEVGTGTTFKIYLPQSERRAVSVGTKLDGPVVGGSETVLLAEDDAMVCELTRHVLERAGYTVLQAADGDEALVVFERHADAIDVAILDVIMPGLGGRQVYERILQIKPQVRVLFASGYSMNAVHTNFVLDEGLTLIQKPYDRSTLLRKLRDVLD